MWHGAGETFMDGEERLHRGEGRSRLGVTGTDLIHYGATWNPAAKLEAGQESVAVIVCHGMGQQVRYETISAVANALRTEATQEGGQVDPVEVHLSKENDAFLARAELNWRDTEKVKHCVHVYEAYWAPLTEGKVTYWDTLKFLFGAAWTCFRYSRGKFTRWMFGGRKNLTIGRWGPLLLLAIVVFLIAQVGVGLYVSAVLVQMYGRIIAAPLPLGADIFKWGQWLAWGHEAMKPLVGSGWHAIGIVVLLAVLVGASYGFRYFLVEYVGDVAAYISPYKDSKFDELRKAIQKVGLDVGKIVYGFGKDSSTAPEYEKVIVVGHSLGSVLAYDTLNALINLDNVSSDGQKRDVVGRTRALVTFGSPLDKTAFIFRMQAKSDEDWIREQMTDSVQPLIVSYAEFRPETLTWVNIWSRMDIISGSLDYYDDPAMPADLPQHVQNMVDPQANIPLAAHVQYWNNELLRKTLYGFVSSPPNTGQLSVRQAVSKAS
jgi:hypothetical protein